MRPHSEVEQRLDCAQLLCTDEIQEPLGTYRFCKVAVKTGSERTRPIFRSASYYAGV
jgi:hypothetical protein